MRRGLVLGCGGTLGAAWTVGALHGLQESLEWDPRTAEITVGTSAGAEYGAMLAAGVSVDDLLLAQRGDANAPAWLLEHLAGAPGLLPPVPLPWPTAPRLALRALRGRAPVMAGLTGLLPRGRDRDDRMDRLGERLSGPDGWVTGKQLWLVAVDLGTGARTVFGREGSPAATLSQALRASWCVPAWYPPVEIGGGCYADGGVCSTASVDLLLHADLDEVVVVAPMASSGPVRPRTLAGRGELLLRTVMSRRLTEEVALLQAAGVAVRRVDMSDADLAVAGANFNDDRRRVRVLEQSLSTHRAAATGAAARPGVTVG